MKRVCLWLCLSLAWSLQAQAAPKESTVKIQKSRGALQCQPGTGTTPEAMVVELDKADVKVLKTQCGQDGLLHVAMCGSDDGSINIFEIPERQLAKATSIGFKPLADLPDSTIIPCPK